MQDQPTTTPSHTQDETIILPVMGMSCASCAVSVESILRTQQGVKDARVNFSDGTVKLTYDPQRITIEQLRSAMQQIGYDLVLPEHRNQLMELKSQRAKTLQRQLLIGLLFTLPLVIIAMFLPPFPNSHLLQLFLALPVVFYTGREFFVNAAKQLRHRRANMDTLVALGTGSAFVLSIGVTLFPEWFTDLHRHVYYEAAAVVITLVLAGRYLEERAKERTTDAIQRLVALQPQFAIVHRDGQWVKLPISAIRKNDVVLVREGEKFPVDGLIIDGTVTIDESMLTGEPIPVTKIEGEQVYSGTLLKRGTATLRATKVGESTLLSQIIHFVQQAQSQKPPIQKFVDKIAAIFVPIVLIIAVITFLLWLLFGPSPSLVYATTAAISVLVIACPCALGLATPTALTVGIGKAAEFGILIKNIRAIEAARQIDTIVFDKTGTITEGKPTVVDIHWLSKDQQQQQSLLQRLIAAEQRSSHPLASAIVNSLAPRVTSTNGIKPQEVETVVGKGIIAKFDTEILLIGNEQLLHDFNLTPPPEGTNFINTHRQQAHTLVFVASTTTIHCILAIADPPKSEAQYVCQFLKQQGLTVILLTGDHRASAQALAQQIGIDEVLAEVSPLDKGRCIQQLLQQGHHVLMVGDGINDAPALVQATIGVALGTGTDIAIDSADIVIIRGNLEAIPQMLSIAQRTERTIKENLFWAFIYNLLAIPVAAGVLYPLTGWLLNPMIAGAAMALSSVSVVTNSLRLRSFTPPIVSKPHPESGAVP